MSGKWLTQNEYNPSNLCPICQEPLGTEQAIYKTVCGHIFHNNCLDDLCNIENGEPKCPVCRRELDYNMCMNVYCFREECLAPNIVDSMPSNVQIIYYGYEIPIQYRDAIPSDGSLPSQGGKSKSRKRRTNKRKTNNRKGRKNKKTRKNRKMRRYLK
jgi:hypothetical protein